VSGSGSPLTPSCHAVDRIKNEDADRTPDDNPPSLDAMRELTPENTADYLRETGRVDADRAVEVRALGWGVSNVVMRVDVAGAPPFVLKQARAQLRTKKLWVSRLERVWTERDALQLLDTILPAGTVPRVLWSDDDNYLFAMSHAPEESVVWKEQLLAGVVDPETARRAGTILGTIHRATVDHPALNGRFADTTVFDELRIDPFYCELARVHPEIKPQIDALIASMANPPARCLVLADFSPKNILVHDHGLTLVDFETAHAGDPAFDLGFVLSHLELKRIAASVCDGHAVDLAWSRLSADLLTAYAEAAGALASQALWTRANRHLRACEWARIDGKSPVDYLDDDVRTILGKSFARKFVETMPT
jgi:5-methylthioribose kinase